MWEILKSRIQQGHRTLKHPGRSEMPERFRGRPLFDFSLCRQGCRDCQDVCPTSAIRSEGAEAMTLDLGRCLFCQECVLACPEGAITYSRETAMAASNREDLIVKGLKGQELKLAGTLVRETRRLFGRSLRLRQVCAGSCSGCEQELTALNNVVFDLSRFGIQFVASPRHADGLIVTGSVTRNMKQALQKAYNAVPAPKIVIAVGACAISGGPFVDMPDVHNGVDGLLPVDLYVPGCPPHPLTILDGLLRLLGKIP